MFLKALRALCAECDWIVDDPADTCLLYIKARAVVVAGRRSSFPTDRAIAHNIDIVINSGAYTAADLIDTFKDII